MSIHNLIVGQTLSGKTWLAKHLAKEQSENGFNVIVYDPVKSTGWPMGDNVIKFADPEKFFNYIETAKSAFVYIDEARTLWDFDPRRANRILYQGRHRGLKVYLIAQRAKMVEPNARDMCATVYAFKQSYDDAKELSYNYEDEVIICAKVVEGEFIASTPFSSEKYKLDFSTLPPSPVPAD